MITFLASIIYYLSTVNFKMLPYQLPLPIELREKIYKIFIGYHTMDKDIQERMKVVCISMWIRKMKNGITRGQPAIELFKMREYIQEMINDTQFDDSEIKVLTSVLLNNFYFWRDRDTYQWTFKTPMLNGRTCSEFVEKLKRKAKQFNFYMNIKRHGLIM